MPNWNNLYDIYNNTGDNFNPYGVRVITKDHIKKYFPYGEICQQCMLDFELPQKVCFKSDICKTRIKDQSACKTYVLARSLGREKDYDSLNIRTGNMTWLFVNKIQLILRACNENGLELHHIMANPYDNRGKMVALVDKHSVIHGHLKSLITRIGSLITIANKIPEYRDDIFNEIQKLQVLYKKMQKGVSDSPRVYKIIDINTQVIQGRMPIIDAQRRLEDIEAAIPQDVKEKYDLRKIKNKQKKIIEFERRKSSNAI